MLRFTGTALAIWLAAAAGLAAAGQPKLPAFPGAEGYGAASTGGRGGKVIKVTNLKGSGPGSLPWACAQSGPRIIVFDVSGVITPDRRSKSGRYVSLGTGKITIAGQTAPGAGITIAGSLLSGGRHGKGNVDDVIVRFLRVRPTEGRGNLRTLVTRPSVRYIADHISGSWSLDQCFNACGGNDVTFQWCSIEETDIGLEGSQPHSFGLFGSYNKIGNTSVHHSLLVHHAGRCPDFDENYRVDFRNNLLYNLGYDETVMRWLNRSKDKSKPFASFNVVGNTWRIGPGGMVGIRAYLPPVVVSRQGYVPGHRTGRYWFDGNRFDLEGLVGREKYSGGKARLHADKPFPMPPVTTQTADEASDLVLAQVGCLPRDAVSARTMAEARTRTGTWGRHGPDGGLMEGLTPGKAPPDSDKDGMPDEWEKARGLNPNNPADNSGIVPAGASPGDRHKGYTYIEYYINDCADRLVAEALTKARLTKTPPRPWDRPATKLSPDASPHKSTEEMAAAVLKQSVSLGKGGLSPAWNAAQQLSRMGEKAAPAVSAIAKNLEKGKADPRAVSCAAWALGAIGPPARKAVPALIVALKTEQKPGSGKWSFRTYGFLAWALGRIGMTDAQAREAVPVLARLLSKDGGYGHSQPPIAWALSRAGKAAEPAMPVLLQTLSREKYGAGYCAARALVNVGAPALPGLIKALGATDVAGRRNAARALGWMGSAAESAAPALIAQLKKDPSGSARGRMALALAAVAPRSGATSKALAALLADAHLDARVSAATALSKCGPAAAGAIPALEKALGDKRKEVRRAAALALGRIGKAALPALERALAGADPLVRKYAARSVGDLGADAAGSVAALVKALGDSDAQVRREAVWSLALVGPAAKAASKALAKAQKDDADYMVRVAAAEALRRVRK